MNQTKDANVRLQCEYLENKVPLDDKVRFFSVKTHEHFGVFWINFSATKLFGPFSVEVARKMSDRLILSPIHQIKYPMHIWFLFFCIKFSLFWVRYFDLFEKNASRKKRLVHVFGKSVVIFGSTICFIAFRLVESV